MIKCLKRLCISLLIGLPILFVNFSSATRSPHTIWAYFGSDYQVSVLVDWNLNTVHDNWQKYIFAPRGDLIFYWDINSKPNLIPPYCYSNRYWWELLYYYECDEIPDINFTNMDNCGSPQSIDTAYLGDFMSSIDLNDNWAFQINEWLNVQYAFDICFSSKHYSKSLCFWVQSAAYNMWCDIFQRDFTSIYWYVQIPAFSWEQYSNLTYTYDTIPDSVIWFAPWRSNVPNIPTYDIWSDTYTNWDIIAWYEYLWLDVGYCYWGFDIDNIFLPTETIDDFTWYQFGYGATVFDLYNLYSGAYSTPKTFFAQMSQAYSNGQINRFKNEPKALIMFVQQFMSAKSRGRVNVWFYDLRDYCNLKFNANPDDEYTWHNETWKRGADQNKTDNQNKWWFNFTWNNALNLVVWSWGTGFSNPAQFFWNITQLFQNWVWVVETNYSWLIPTYILMFMFALILIRIIKH